MSAYKNDKSGLSAFLVFDSPLLPLDCLKDTFHQIDLFPLTSDWRDIESLSANLGSKNKKINILNSAKLINDEFAASRNNFIEWAGSIGNIEIESQSIRKWLLLSDKGISAWWFSLLADKDPIKSNSFLRVVQTQALLKQIESQDNAQVILFLKDRGFASILGSIFRKRKIKFRLIAVKPTGQQLLTGIKDIMFFRMVINIFGTLRDILIRVVYLKIMMPTLKTRQKHFDQALLFFSYFPSLGKPTLACAGSFRNKFAVPLQELCRANQKTIVWVLKYANFDGKSFRDAVKLAKGFICNGEKMFFYLEFVNLRIVLRAFWEYLRIVLIWVYLRLKLNPCVVNKITGNDFASFFFFKSLDDSFYGDYSLVGILEYYTFKDLFKKVYGFSHGLYTCEMMVWEYALCAAKENSRAEFPLIGYQDFAISYNYLHMYHSRDELRCKNSPGGIPLPEFIAGCGRIPQRLLAEYYDSAENLETMRHFYLNEVFQDNFSKIKIKKEGGNVLLVCTNINFEESRALIGLVKSAYGHLEDNFQIWFKEHPVMPIQKILEEYGIRDNVSYKIKQGPLLDFFPQSDIVLTGSTTAAVEALAFGCSVLVYFSPEMINQSPLITFDDYYFKVYGPEGLRGVINDILSGKEKAGVDKKQKFVKDYWNVDPSLSSWKRVLALK